MSTLALYFNTAIFEEAGVSIDEVPDTLEAYVEWLPSFQEKSMRRMVTEMFLP